MTIISDATLSQAIVLKFFFMFIDKKEYESNKGKKSKIVTRKNMWTKNHFFYGFLILLRLEIMYKNDRPTNRRVIIDLISFFIPNRQTVSLWTDKITLTRGRKE